MPFCEPETRPNDRQELSEIVRNSASHFSEDREALHGVRAVLRDGSLTRNIGTPVEPFILFTIGLKVVVKSSDVRHDCQLRWHPATNPNMLLGGGRTLHSSNPRQRVIW